MKTTAPKKLKTFAETDKGISVLGVFSYNERVYLYFRLPSDSPSRFRVAISRDGFSFELEKRQLSVKKGLTLNEDITLCDSFNISEYAGHFLLVYVKRKNNKALLEKAWSDDLLSWNYEGNMIPLCQKSIIALNYTHKGKSILYSSKTSIFAYFSADLIHWKKEEGEVLSPRDGYFDSKELIAEFAINSEKGILLLYRSEVENVNNIGIALFNRDHPTHLLWRGINPVWTQPKEWKKKKVELIGIALHGTNILTYWQVINKAIYVSICAIYKESDGHTSKDVSLKLKRPAHNPLISPKNHNAWEAFNTFNPAAIYDDGKVHILYRAQGYDYFSALGYATSQDGTHINERLSYPVYIPSMSFEKNNDQQPSRVSTQYVSGGGYGGCEDPRLTRIDDRYYLTYVAFDGVNPPRIALTSIARDNFLNKRWLWERPVLISPPGIVAKSAIIFPKKIGGKYVVMHRIYPDILIDFVDSLNFNGKFWLKGEYKISPRKNKWDSRKIGAGAPPLETKAGWLLIYQSVGEQDPGRYKIGAMLLDLKDPTKVLCRSQSPILEPETTYENNGFKAGVVYPCGAVIIDKTLYVYYGAADSYVCVATANLDEFLSELQYSEITCLTTPVIEKIF